MELEAGTRLGRYKIVALLGSGGMGEVYRAIDEMLGRSVAIKVLPPKLSADADALRRLEREAKILASLSHPNILAIHDVGTEKDSLYFVTELLEGQSLRQMISLESLRWRQAAEIAIQIAEALSAAHSEGVVHRDLKPENVFITSKGLVKILDFGLARVQPLAADPENAKTESVSISGTLPYMSPEQLRGALPDVRSDVFAFGCLLFEMIAGHSPFLRGSSVEVITAIMNEDPPHLPKNVKDLEHLIAHCLEKNPERRFQSAHDIAITLKGLLRGTTSESKSLLKKRSQKAISSLAVLPFENVGADSATEYLSDGITEGIINSLSQLPKLKVMARATVFHYRKSNVDPLEAGRHLNVGAVLTGRVVQQGDQLMIATELIDVNNGWNLWGEQYSRPFKDVFELQSNIVQQITNQLRLKVTGKEKKLLKKKATENSEAYRHYLRGRYAWNRRSQESLKNAIEHFNQAIETDPLFSLAYTGLADSYALLGDFGFPSASPGELFSMARSAIAKALEIDNSLAEAHTSRAHILTHEFQWHEAEQAYLTAIELNPGYATAYHWYFITLTITGRFDAAKKHMQTARDLDPLSLIIQTDIASCYYFNAKYEQAMDMLRKVLELDPNFPSAHRFLTAVLEQTGKFDEAISAYEKARILAGKHADAAALQAEELKKAFAESGASGYWKKRLDHLMGKASKGYVSPYNKAQIYASLGDTESTFNALDQAYKEPSASLIYVKVDPRFNLVRSDPRFNELLRKINLT
jgi:serine/threonine-protein kinase